MMTRFVTAVRSPKHRLGRELGLVLLIKLVIVTLAALYVFGPKQRPHIDAAEVAAHLIGALAPALPSAPFNPVAPRPFAQRSEIQ